MRWLATAALVSAAINSAHLFMAPPIGRGLELKLEADTAVPAAGMIGLGMRRMAGDLGLIRLCVYYGTPEKEEPGHHEGDGHNHGGRFDPSQPEKYWGGGSYPELGPRARRILDVDPTFTYAALFSAGALAFNLNRPDEALELLRFALAKDPNNIQLRSYVAAIGFHRKGDANQVIAIMEPTLGDPGTPTMIKSIMAFLYRRNGQHKKAAMLYLDILENSRDAGYRGQAQRALEEMAKGPRK